jgi:hypothetical protein
MRTKFNAALLSLMMTLGVIFIAGETIHAQDVYRVGYSYGQQDRQAGRKKNFKRYSNQYDKYEKKTFKQGYDDGYRNADNDNRDRYGNGDYGNYGNGGYRNDNYGNYGSTVPNWMVGTFRGYTPGNNTYTQIVIYPDGNINIAAENGTGASRGYYQNERVYFQWGEYRFKREGNGFRAINLDNSNDRVYYQRVR